MVYEGPEYPSNDEYGELLIGVPELLDGAGQPSTLEFVIETPVPFPIGVSDTPKPPPVTLPPSSTPTGTATPKTPPSGTPGVTNRPP